MPYDISYEAEEMHINWDELLLDRGSHMSSSSRISELRERSVVRGNLLKVQIGGHCSDRGGSIGRGRELAKAVLLGLALAIYCGGAKAGAPGESFCAMALGDGTIIPEKVKFETIVDSSLDYQFRECAGQLYAMQHPESVGKFIKLLNSNDRSTVRIAIWSLGRMGPDARSAVPFLLENDYLKEHAFATNSALIMIGVVDRKSIDKLLEMAIKEHDSSAIEVLAKQKSLPAYVGEAVISALDAGANSEGGSGFPEFARILIPVRTPKAIERYVELTNRFMIHPCCGVRHGFDFFKSDFQQIGTSCIPALVNNFWKQDDLDSKTYSIVVLLGLGKTDSIEVARRLGEEMLPLILKDLTVVKDPVESENEKLMVSLRRINYLGPMVKPVGRELLVLLEQASEAKMRRSLMWKLEKIEYTDALPIIRRLASEDSDPEVRKIAVEVVGALEEVLSKAKDLH